MEFKITIWSAFLMFGCTQSFFLIVAFCLKKENRHARNLVLSLLLFLFAVIEFDHSLRLSTLYKTLPNLIYISDGLWFLIAPTLFFIAKFYVQPLYKFKWLDVLHLIPFLVMQFLYFNLLTASSEVKVGILESYKEAGEYDFVTVFLISSMMVQILIYILASLNAFKNYSKRYKTVFSKNQLGQLKMFRNIYRFFLFYFLIEFSFSSFRNYTGFESELLDNWSLVVWTFFIYGIGYIAILYPTFILPKLQFLSEQKQPEPTPKDHTEMERITEYLIAEKPYKKNDLILPELAESLRISTNRASFLINKVQCVSFYDFINTYRVKEVKEMIERGKYKQMSIIGISQEAGFRSKSSFYKFFKREYGKTPTQYITDLENHEAK